MHYDLSCDIKGITRNKILIVIIRLYRHKYIDQSQLSVPKRKIAILIVIGRFAYNLTTKTFSRVMALTSRKRQVITNSDKLTCQKDI